MATANPSSGSDAAINQEIEKLKEKLVTPPASEITSLIADIKATKVDASKNIVHLRPIMDHIFPRTPKGGGNESSSNCTYSRGNTSCPYSDLILLQLQKIWEKHLDTL